MRALEGLSESAKLADSLLVSPCDFPAGLPFIFSDGNDPVWSHLILWLLAWADPGHALERPKLHRCGLTVMKLLFSSTAAIAPGLVTECHLGPCPLTGKIRCWINHDFSLTLDEPVEPHPPEDLEMQVAFKISDHDPLFSGAFRAAAVIAIVREIAPASECYLEFERRLRRMEALAQARANGRVRSQDSYVTGPMFTQMLKILRLFTLDRKIYRVMLGLVRRAVLHWSHPFGRGDFFAIRALLDQMALARRASEKTAEIFEAGPPLSGIDP